MYIYIHIYIYTYMYTFIALDSLANSLTLPFYYHKNTPRIPLMARPHTHTHIHTHTHTHIHTYTFACVCGDVVRVSLSTCIYSRATNFKWV